jgi:hypothetical protein
MINFFRKIRKKLADDNKPLKYMRYAIGEIILVVIGILIALQVNNLNEERKGSQAEYAILINLKKDFEVNKETLILQNEDMQGQIEQINILLDLTPNTIPDSLILYNFFRTYYGLRVVSFQPADATLRETISSGKLQIIGSEILRGHLTTWMSELEEVKEHESKIINLKELELRPFLIECCPEGIDYQENYVLALSDYRFRTILQMFERMLHTQVGKREVLQELVTGILMNLDKEIG